MNYNDGERMNNLLPCPFCGNKNPEIEDHRTIWVVRCDCGVCMLGQRAPEPDGSEPDEYWDGIRQTAIDAWNRRVEEENISAREKQIEIREIMLDSKVQLLDVKRYIVSSNEARQIGIEHRLGKYVEHQAYSNLYFAFWQCEGQRHELKRKVAALEAEIARSRA